MIPRRSGVGLALRNAVFEGLDIGRPDVVKPIADRFGLDVLDGGSHVPLRSTPTGTRDAPAA